MKFEIHTTATEGIWEAYAINPPLYLAIIDLSVGSNNILHQVPSKVFKLDGHDGKDRFFEIVYYQIPSINKLQALLHMEELWQQFKETIYNP